MEIKNKLTVARMAIITNKQTTSTGKVVEKREP